MNNKDELTKKEKIEKAISLVEELSSLEMPDSKLEEIAAGLRFSGGGNVTDTQIGSFSDDR